jgi:PleD family two-component response regulator
MPEATQRLGLVNAALATRVVRGSISMGVADLQTNDAPQDLIARADAALYRGRRSHR